MDPVMVELRSQWETKRTEAEIAQSRFDQLIGADLEAANLELAKAEQLQKDMDGIEAKIADYQSARKREREVRERVERSVGAMTAPNRILPFSAGGADRFGEKPKGDEGDDLARKSSRPEARRFIVPTFDAQGKFAVVAGDSEIQKVAPTGGFKSFGHFAWSVARRGRDGRGDLAAIDALKSWGDLQVKAPSGMFEESDPDGGDLIPRDFSNQVYERMLASNQILTYLEGLPLTGNTLTIPALKEDSRVDGSRHGGVLGYWEGEADQYNKTNPRFRNITLKLHKLTVLTYVTEELLMDSAVALEGYLGRLVPKEINFKVNDAIINGTGAGMPMGVMKANSKVTVASSGGGATTYTYKDVTNMWARAIAGQRSTAIWLYNQDVEHQFYRMFLPTGTAAGVAVFVPNQQYSFEIMGRPALVMEQCQSLGTEGDVILFCPEGYATVLKGGLQSFMSMHLRFDYDEFAYKWRFRMDAQPYDDVALTPFKGTNTYSSIVTLSSTRT